LDFPKNAAIPAIRVAVNAQLTMKMAVLRHFREVSAFFLCQVALFHFSKKTALKAAAEAFRTLFPGANPRRGQERKRANRARLGSGATVSFCLLRGQMREARTGERRRREFGD
jgi:hypothetical protein